jgi:hypothetical protein
LYWCIYLFCSFEHFKIKFVFLFDLMSVLCICKVCVWIQFSCVYISSCFRIIHWKGYTFCAEVPLVLIHYQLTILVWIYFWTFYIWFYWSTYLFIW